MIGVRVAAILHSGEAAVSCLMSPCFSDIAKNTWTFQQEDCHLAKKRVLFPGCVVTTFISITFKQ